MEFLKSHLARILCLFGYFKSLKMKKSNLKFGKIQPKNIEPHFCLCLEFPIELISGPEGYRLDK